MSDIIFCVGCGETAPTGETIRHKGECDSDSVINWTAVRTFDRIWIPVLRQLWIQANCDEQYDAGEWSSEAHGQIQELTHRAYVEKVARYFKLTASQLDRMLVHAAFEADDRMHKALMVKII